MITQLYRKNRASFSPVELAKHHGAWVAFSADGSCIVASAETVARLEEQLAAGHPSLSQVVLEWLPGPDEDSLLGAEAWM